MMILESKKDKYRKEVYPFLANYFAIVLFVFGVGFSAQSWAYDCNAQNNIPPSECMALLTLMDVLELVNDSDTSLNIEEELGWAVTGSNPCEWGGVSCIDSSGAQLADNGYIHQIAIAGGGNPPTHFKLKKDANGKSLSLPDFCTMPGNGSSLPKLFNLNLRSHDFSGTTIPNFCLPELQYLNLSNSKLEGTIPDFTNSQKLYELKLNDNNLIGNIPSLPLSVQKLYVENNNLHNQCSGKVCNITIRGFIFHDKDKNKKYNFSGKVNDDQKIAFYNKLFVNNGVTSVPIAVDKYGNFEISIKETGELKITNYNTLGWMQTTPLNANTEPKTGSYLLALSGNPVVDYSNVAIGVAKEGVDNGTPVGIQLLYSPVYITGFDSCNMYNFTCAPKGKAVKSCQIYFDEHAPPTTLNQPNLSIDHLFYSATSKSVTVSATAFLDDDSFVKAEDITVSIVDGFECLCDSKKAKYISNFNNAGKKEVEIILNNGDPKITKNNFVLVRHSTPISKLSTIPTKGYAICIHSSGSLFSDSNSDFKIGNENLTDSNNPPFIYNRGTIEPI